MPESTIEERLSRIEKKVDQSSRNHSDTGIGCLGLILFVVVIGMLSKLMTMVTLLMEAQGLSLPE